MVYCEIQNRNIWWNYLEIILWAAFLRQNNRPISRTIVVQKEAEL
jgi:hypothetical protein